VGGCPIPPQGGGGYINGTWYTEHALERMAPDTPYIRALLQARFNLRLEGSGFQPGTPEYNAYFRLNLPDPRGVPASVVQAKIDDPESVPGITVVVNESGGVITVQTQPGDLTIDPDLVEP
jgi:hypothetical protein